MDFESVYITLMRIVGLIAGYLVAMGLLLPRQEPPASSPIDFSKFAPQTVPPSPVSLDEALDGKETVKKLASRLRLMNGDYDNLLKQLKDVQSKNAGKKLSPDELLGQFSGTNQSLLKSLLEKMKLDPNFDPLKFMGNGGPSMDSLKSMLDGIKTDGMSKMPDLKGGNFDLGNLQGKMAGGFQLPEGSPKWLEGAVKGWEKNVGPLSNNPELQKMLEGFLNKENGFDPGKIKEWFNGKGFDMKQLDGLIGKNKFDFSKLPDPKLDLNLKSAGSNTKLPSWNWGSNPNWSPPSAPSTGGWSFPSFGGIGGAGLSSLTPIAIVLGIILVAVLLWWFWPQIQEKLSAVRGKSLIELPDGFDPRLVTDRDTLVKAFELLSVVLCGPSSKTWNHITLGGALQEFLTTNPAGAEQLSVLYALARYTPTNEPLTPEAISQARQALCSLAGVTSV